MIAAISKRLRCERGFTVVEVAIGSALAMIVMWSLFSLLDSGTRNERGQQARYTALLELREATTRSYLVETLKDLNYRVREAANGAAALSLFDANPFRIDLLLTDIVMPGLNGRELADQLHHRQSGLRVLFMTGYSRDAIVHQGRLDAGVSLLQKPVT
jgi:CheY-like chemotaxis protein